jgi:hypothetical protein
MSASDQEFVPLPYLKIPEEVFVYLKLMEAEIDRVTGVYALPYKPLFGGKRE